MVVERSCSTEGGKKKRKKNKQTNPLAVLLLHRFLQGQCVKKGLTDILVGNNYEEANILRQYVKPKLLFCV